MAIRTTRSEKLDLRLTRTAKRALQVAAVASHRSVSQFVLESALARAEETLADHRTFGLNAEQWKAFQTVLGTPPRPLSRLERLPESARIFRCRRRSCWTVGCLIDTGPVSFPQDDSPLPMGSHTLA